MNFQMSAVVIGIDWNAEIFVQYSPLRSETGRKSEILFRTDVKMDRSPHMLQPISDERSTLTNLPTNHTNISRTDCLRILK